jgi:hypothetical protein
MSRRIKHDYAMPTVHLNGTSRDELLSQYTCAHRRLREAYETMCLAAPHGRDYYTQGQGAYSCAAADHTERLRKITQVTNEIEAIIQHLLEQEPRR